MGITGISGTLLTVGAGARRVVVRRRGVVARPVDVPPDDALRGVVRRVAVLRRALPAVFLVVLAARRVRLAARLVVLAARRLVEAAREPVPRAIWRACFVSPSMRLSTLLTSALVLARLTWVCRVLIAARALLSASLSLRSTCRRTSGGTRLSASRSARRPALTARPTSPDRLDVRFLLAMDYLHYDAARRD